MLPFESLLKCKMYPKSTPASGPPFRAAPALSFFQAPPLCRLRCSGCAQRASVRQSSQGPRLSLMENYGGAGHAEFSGGKEQARLDYQSLGIPSRFPLAGQLKWPKWNPHANVTKNLQLAFVV